MIIEKIIKKLSLPIPSGRDLIVKCHNNYIDFINYKKNLLYINTFYNSNDNKYFIIYDLNKEKIIEKKEVIKKNDADIDSWGNFFDKVNTNKGIFFIYKTSEYSSNEVEKIIQLYNIEKNMKLMDFDFIGSKYISLLKNQPPNTLSYFDHFDYTIKPINLETKELKTHFTIYEAPNINFMKFTYSPYHKYILACDPNVLYIWEVKTGKLLKKFDYEPDDIESIPKIATKGFFISNIQFTPNGKYLLLPCDYIGDCEKGSLCYVIDFASMEVLYRLGDIYFNSEKLNPDHLLYFTDFGVKNALISRNDKYVFLENMRIGTIVFELETGKIKEVIDEDKYAKIFLDPENENRFKAFTRDGFFIEAEFEY